MTDIHASFSELGHLLNCKHVEHFVAPQFLISIQHRIQNFKALLKDAFDDYLETNLSTLKFRLLQQVTEDFDRFKCSELLGRSP